MISPSTLDLEKSIRAYVAAGSGLDPNTNVIPGNEKGAPAPNDLYATVLLITDDDQGVAYQVPTTRSDNDLDVDTVQTVRARYSVQWYRTGARGAARRFRLWAQSPLGIEDAATRNLTFLGVSEIRRLDAIVSDDWEERVGLDLDLGYLEAIADQHIDGIAEVPAITITPDGGTAEEVEIPA